MILVLILFIVWIDLLHDLWIIMIPRIDIWALCYLIIILTLVEGVSPSMVLHQILINTIELVGLIRLVLEDFLRSLRLWKVYGNFFFFILWVDLWINSSQTWLSLICGISLGIVQVWVISYILWTWNDLVYLVVLLWRYTNQIRDWWTISFHLIVVNTLVFLIGLTFFDILFLSFGGTDCLQKLIVKRLICKQKISI